MKKNNNFMIIVIIILISVFAYYFLKNDITKEPGDVTEIKTIDSTIHFSDYYIDLNQREGIITYNELIALAGKVLKKQHLNPNENENWFEPYVNKAKEQGWLNKDYPVPNDYVKELSKQEGIEFFSYYIQNNGEDSYPLDMSYYKDEKLSGKLLRAYTQGIMIFEENELNENLTKGDAYDLLDIILNPSKRKIPFHIKKENRGVLKIIDYEIPSGKYFTGENIPLSLDINNTSNGKKNYWLEVKFIDPLGVEYLTPLIKKELAPEETSNINTNWSIPDNITSGHYHLVMSLWDGIPSNSASTKIANLEVPNLLMVYNNQDNFTEIKKENWRLSQHNLGRTVFYPEKVSTNNGFLEIKMPANSFESGEIQSIDLKGYGSYEIRMKIPDASGSITGFFMYKAPDYFFEIDIEIYNQKSGDYFLTTYADGAKQNEFLGVLPFDPTKNYNNYRFDYYPDKLNYYINDIFIVSFNKGFPKEPMSLMVNSWYPNWVEGGPASEDKVFSAEWIRY